MDIVFLDQNKWIELARADASPDVYVREAQLLSGIREEIRRGAMVIPLSASNIYETFKTNDRNRRAAVGGLQAELSRGIVIRGRHARLAVEIGDVLSKRRGLQIPDRKPDWFLSKVFFEAVAEIGDPRIGIDLSPRLESMIIRSEGLALLDYFMNSNEEVRRQAIRNFTLGTENLRVLVEKRRSRDKRESIDFRRRLYSAIFAADDLDLINQSASTIGIRFNPDGSDLVAIMADAPTYAIEIEIALKLEAHTRPIAPNDFRDMQSFCAVTPYVDEIVSENLFVSIAKQSRLDKRYETTLGTSILGLEERIERLRSEGTA